MLLYIIPCNKGGYLTLVLSSILYLVLPCHLKLTLFYLNALIHSQLSCFESAICLTIFYLLGGAFCFYVFRKANMSVLFLSWGAWLSSKDPILVVILPWTITDTQPTLDHSPHAQLLQAAPQNQHLIDPIEVDLILFRIPSTNLLLSVFA